MSIIDSVKKPLRAAKQWVNYQRLPSASPSGRAGPAAKGTLIVTPADPGSLGDGAMLRAIADRYAADGLDVSCWRYPGAPAYPDTRAQVDIRRLKGPQAESTLAEYRRFCCVGADVMDGLYAYADSCLRLRLLGLAAAMGLESRLLGFSFNATPHPRSAAEFRQLHRDVVVCVRDPISHARLARVTGHELRLVADMAFLVKPVQPSSPSARAALDWITNQRQTVGRQVIGLNLHPLFSFDHGRGITQGLIDAFVSLVAAHPDQAFVLVPHDFRPVFGDLPVLQSVFDALPVEARARVALVSDIHDPAALKGFVGHLDGVLTGRMHLAIAAMGQGVPVAGITYQGKFEGLLQHFGLGEGMTIAPPDAADAGRLQRFYAAWLTGLDRQAAALRSQIDHVTALSRLNFEDPA